MVEVVFHEVVFGEVGYVCVLDVREVRHLEESDIHDDGVDSRKGGCGG